MIDPNTKTMANVLTNVCITSNVLTEHTCQEIIRIAEEHAAAHQKNGGWQTDRHKIYKTVDVDVRHVPHLLSLCNHLLEDEILFVLAELFDLPVEDIIMDDLFVVKYSVGDAIVNQTSLPPHQDDSVLSFVITLNTDYDGGGTEFVNWKCDSVEARISSPKTAGTMTSFCGLQLHAGRKITRGNRYILTGFCKVDDVDKKTRKLGERLYPYPFGK